MSTDDANKNNVCAAIITYYPDAKLPSRIASFAPYVRETVIIDNHSDDSTVALLRKLSSKPDIHLIANPENLGIATALNQAAGWAVERGYEWLLTMDQDSIFDLPMAARYFSCFQRMKDKKDVAIFSPQHLLQFEEPGNPEFSCDFEEKSAVMMSANLVNLGICTKIGGFEDKLFIDGVDYDYCLKARLKGFRIIQFNNITLNHKLGEALLLSETPKKKKIHVHAPERLYYITRNNLYLWHKYKEHYPEVIRRSRRHLLKRIRNVLLYENDRVRKISNVIRGVFSFLIGKYGP